MPNVNVEDHHVKTRTSVDDHQLLSMEKLLENLTNSSSCMSSERGTLWV